MYVEDIIRERDKDGQCATRSVEEVRNNTGTNDRQPRGYESSMPDPPQSLIAASRCPKMLSGCCCYGCIKEAAELRRPNRFRFSLRTWLHLHYVLRLLLMPCLPVIVHYTHTHTYTNGQKSLIWSTNTSVLIVEWEARQGWMASVA